MQPLSTLRFKRIHAALRRLQLPGEVRHVLVGEFYTRIHLCRLCGTWLNCSPTQPTPHSLRVENWVCGGSQIAAFVFRLPHLKLISTGLEMDAAAPTPAQEPGLEMTQFSDESNDSTFHFQILRLVDQVRPLSHSNSLILSASLVFVSFHFPDA